MRAIVLAMLLSSEPGAPPAGLPIQDPEAQAHFQRGMEYFAADDLPAARHELELAYEREPHPDLLYARAQVHRLMGDCPTAISLYEEFLRTGPPEVAAKEASVNLERCGAPRSRPPAPPEPTPAPAPAPVQTPPAKPRPDRVGVALVSVGGVALTAGVATAILGGLTVAGLDDAPTHRDYTDDRRQATAAFAAAGVVGGLGVALTAAGAARLVRSRSSRARLGLGGPRRSLGLNLTLAF